MSRFQARVQAETTQTGTQQTQSGHAETAQTGTQQGQTAHGETPQIQRQAK
jgi:hypothetical protein